MGDVLRKKCSVCNKRKDLKEFYLCAGKHRSECKICTIKKNGKRQKSGKTWRTRYKNDDSRQAYMREYYAKNKEKFEQYRQTFRDKHPGYNNEYYHNNKEKYEKK